VFGRPWTEEEKALLRRAYITGGIKAAKAAFPHRSEWGLYHILHRMGVQRARRWTREDIDHLRTYWGTETLPSLCRTLKRTRPAICGKARLLGLPLGCPQGLEYLTRAARRTGYKVKQIRRILRWAGVGIKMAYSARPKFRTHIVDPFDVDEAVKEWHETETLDAACKRLGIDDRTLKRRLERVGVTPCKTDPENPRAHYRIKTKDIDTAMQFWRESETIDAGAKRVGTTAWLLRKYLRQEGILPVSKPRTRPRIPSREIDRVIAKHEREEQKQSLSRIMLGSSHGNPQRQGRDHEDRGWLLRGDA
jgi:hypothetical protein